MNYDVIALACEQLSYRDKLRLAQLLIQIARKEEENENPQHRAKQEVLEKTKTKKEPLKELDSIEYVVERLLKLKPVRRKSLLNSIKSMFQFQGGISDSDINKIIAELQKRKYIKLEQDTVHYL
ncbi:MAG: hypothetical protein DCF12_17135 [Snowella sp.]|nr:MAG: hypothetical protein DCF12_17135 [Snowella sp.]